MVGFGVVALIVIERVAVAGRVAHVGSSLSGSVQPSRPQLPVIAPMYATGICTTVRSHQQVAHAKPFGGSFNGNFDASRVMIGAVL